MIPETAAAVFFSIIVILAITNLVIDPYIKATNWGVNLFEFYEKNKENNKIYFIGDSQTVFGVDPVTIEKTMQSNNLSFKVYNIAYPCDSPGSRIVELDGIAESKPKIVVIGFPYFWLNPDFGLYNEGDYREIRSLLACTFQLFCTFQVSPLFIIFNLSYYSYLHSKALEYIKQSSIRYRQIKICHDKFKCFSNSLHFYSIDHVAHRS